MKGTIWIGNDHGGYDLKVRLVEYLADNGYDVHDVGCSSRDIVRYPYYAAQVAEAVSSGATDRGILICSTGIGMSIVANRFQGVRAALCSTTYAAKMTRRHNDSNVLCLGGKTVGEFEALDMLETWLNAEYEGGRHDISLGLLHDAEDILCSGEYWHPEGLQK